MRLLAASVREPMAGTAAEISRPRGQVQLANATIAGHAIDDQGAGEPPPPPPAAELRGCGLQPNRNSNVFGITPAVIERNCRCVARRDEVADGRLTAAGPGPSVSVPGTTSNQPRRQSMEATVELAGTSPRAIKAAACPCRTPPPRPKRSNFETYRERTSL